jgi:hypothetical protein
MTFVPKPNLTYFMQKPTLDHLNGTFKTEEGKKHAYAVRLNITNKQKEELIAKAKEDGVKNQMPTFTGNLNTIGNRVNAFKRRFNGLTSHGWDAALSRPNPTASGGSIKPKQLQVTQEKIKFPGTENVVPARVTVLFETQLNDDSKLSDATEIGKVISYELEKSFLLHRKAEAGASGDANAADEIKGRILMIDAHSGVPMEKSESGDLTPQTMPLTDGVMFTFAVPHEYISDAKTPHGTNQPGKYVSELPRFGSIQKIGKDQELATYSRSLKTEGGLRSAATDAKSMMRMITGTSRPGHIAELHMEKYGGIREPSNAPAGDGTPLHPILQMRGGGTYDQIAFAALNDKKVDIVTIRSGNRVAKSELVDVLDKLGILSQYDVIYDPSCRARLDHSGPYKKMWNPFEDNSSNGPQFGYLKQTNQEGQSEVVAVTDTDKDVQKWQEENGLGVQMQTAGRSGSTAFDLDKFVAKFGRPPSIDKVTIPDD